MTGKPQFGQGQLSVFVPQRGQVISAPPQKPKGPAAQAVSVPGTLSVLHAHYNIIIRDCNRCRRIERKMRQDAALFARLSLCLRDAGYPPVHCAYGRRRTLFTCRRPNHYKEIQKLQKKLLHFCDTSAIMRLRVRDRGNFIRGYSSAGRALEWHSRGQRFDPAYLHHEKVLKSKDFRAFSLLFPAKKLVLLKPSSALPAHI